MTLGEKARVVRTALEANSPLAGQFIQRMCEELGVGVDVVVSLIHRFALMP